MIHRIAHEMRQRVFDRLDDRLVEFRLLAFHLDPSLLAAGQRHIAHRSGKLIPDASDGLHAGFHHAFLKFGRELVQALAGTEESAVFGRVGVLHDLVAEKNEFAHTIHQTVEQADINPDRAVARAGPARRWLRGDFVRMIFGLGETS